MTTRRLPGGARSGRAVPPPRARGGARHAGAGMPGAPGRLAPPVPRSENFRTEEQQS
ncbi:hypothetical protein [Streptomyces albidochromogenes]|uniref:Uncharacterized protein n=1 Tax=Streptomyces albidochromogenes TaxID=329524 RepID=A0ABW6FY23_9ACTN